MDYSLITEQQIQKKYNSLSNNLKGVLDSENIIESIRQICRIHHLDEEKTLMIEQLVGLVALGFVHPEEVAVEIQENLYLNHKHSIELADEINRKIFSSIKDEIEKAYFPPVGGTDLHGLEHGYTRIEKPIEVKPQEEVLDLREKKPVAPPPFDPSVFNNIKEVSASPPVPPKSLVVNPLTQFSTSRVEPPKFTIGSKPEVGRIETPRAVPVGGGEVEPPPMIIHEKTELKPLTPVSETKKSLGGFFSFLKKEKKEIKQPSIMAKVEIGPGAGLHRTDVGERGKVQYKPAESARVVHYSEFDAPIAPPTPPKTEIPKHQEPEPFMVGPTIEPSVVSQVEPPANLPVVNKVEPLVASKPEIPKPVLDLRKVMELNKPEEVVPRPEPPKSIPPVPPYKPPEPPKPAPKPEGPEGEMVDLRSFK